MEQNFHTTSGLYKSNTTKKKKESFSNFRIMEICGKLNREETTQVKRTPHIRHRKKQKIMKITSIQKITRKERNKVYRRKRIMTEEKEVLSSLRNLY